MKLLVPKNNSTTYLLRVVAFTLAMAVLISACQNVSAPTTVSRSITNVQVTQSVRVGPPTMEPFVFKTSEAGKTTIHGMLVVLDPTTIIPGPEDPIFLVPLDEGSAVSSVPDFEVGKVPEAEVDERTGEFTFTNVNPGNYMIIVITQLQTKSPTRSMKEGGYSVVKVADSDKGKTIELGSISLP